MTFVHKLNHAGDRIVGARGSAVETARGRLMFVCVVVMAAFAMVGVRIAYLCMYQQGAEPKYETLRAADGAVAADTLALGRADIIDRNGVLLATTLPTISLYADPKLIKDAGQVAHDLAGVFPDMDAKALEARLSAKGRFVWVRRGITPDDVRAVNKLGYPALNIRNENRRFYPQESLGVHVVGYTDIDGTGLAGVERSMDARLKQGGEPLQLSIDVRYQHALRRALAQSMQDFNALGAAGVIMDVRTGDVLAAVSLPDYDPHTPSEADDNARFNRFSLGVYEMGSAFKAFTAAAYMESVNASYNQYFDATKPLRRGRFPITDFHAKNRTLSLPEVMMYSSNIGTVLMAEKMGAQTHRDFLERLGLLHPLNIAINERGAPMVPTPWRPITSVTTSYGYGVAVSPLHVARGYAALVNGGTLPKVHFLKAEPPEVEQRVISEKTSERIRGLLRLVVSQGSGSRADVAGMNVGGKTGTAEKNINGRYVRDKRFSSFAGAFPMDNPRYAIVVAMDEPHGNKSTHGYATAGWVATPVVAATVKAIRDIENLPYSKPDMDINLAREVEPLVKEKLKPVRHLASTQND